MTNCFVKFYSQKEKKIKIGALVCGKVYIYDTHTKVFQWGSDVLQNFERSRLESEIHENCWGS